MKKILQNKLLSNIFSLLILQGSNYIFPLLTFPFLVRILGTENYGVLIFCIACMQFLNILVDYGFNISGTREVALNKQSTSRINVIYNRITTIKVILTIIIALLLLIILMLINSTQYKVPLLISYLIIIGNTLFPLWLFQGLEKMKYITYIHLVVKTIVTILIFFFIDNKEDLNKAIFLQTLYYLIPGLFSIYFVRVKFNMKFSFVFDYKEIVGELKKGKYTFFTNLWINFYSQGPLIILGIFAGNTSTGNYGIGQRIMGAFYGLTQPVIQAVYPYLCDLYENNIDKFYEFRKKLITFSILVAIFISAILFSFSLTIIQLVAGEPNLKISIIVKIFAGIVLFSILNTVMARIMYSMNLQKNLNTSYSKAAMIFLICSIPLTFYFEEIGMAIAVIIVEIAIAVMNCRNLILVRLKGMSQSYL